MLLCSDTGGLIFDKETYLHIDGPMYAIACSAAQVLYFFEYKPSSKCQSPSVTPIKVTRVTSRSEPLFQSVKVRKYSNYSVQFWFALCDFEKYGSGSVKV